MAGFEQECAKLVENLGIEYSEGEDVKEVFQRHFNSGSIGKWFLIIDNADDMEILKPSQGTARGIFDFLPNHIDGRILFTTRFMRVAVMAAKNEVVKLSEMDFEEASELLKTSFIKDDVFWAEELRDEKTVVNLLKTLTYLPLAITQATAYMNTNQTSVKDYLHLFEHTDEKNAIELLEQGNDDETYYDKSQSAVATTWIVSFNRIRSSDPTAADVLSFMSTIEPRAIPRSLLPIPETEQQLEKAIGTLLGYGFLTRRDQEATYDMHRLVHLATRRWNEEGRHAQEVQQLALAHVAKVFPDPKWETRHVYQQYLPHAERLLDTIDGIENTYAFAIGYRVSVYLLSEGKLERALRRLKDMDMILEHTSPENDHNQLATKHTLAYAYVSNGQVEKGIRLFEHVDKFQRKILKEDDPNRLATQSQLALAYGRNGQNQEAIKLLEHVVAIQGKLAEDNEDRLISQLQLSSAYHHNGQIEEAIELLEHVVARRREILPEDHPSQVISKHDLATSYLDNGKIKEAIELLEYVVAREREIFPQGHPHSLISQHELGKAYYKNGQIKEAVEQLEYVVARQREVLPQDHLDQLASQQNLAKAYHENGQIEEAIDLLEYVVTRSKKLLLSDHPSLCTSEDTLKDYLDIRSKGSV
jgi:tetratricopeptide (TPR) repeat protein